MFQSCIRENDVWHENWTWKGRVIPGFTSTIAGRFLRFHLTSGLISLAGNLLLMRLFVGTLNLPYVPANFLKKSL